MKEIKIKDLRQFGIVLGLILGAFGLIHFLKGHVNAYPWFWGVGAGALVLGVLVPRALKPVFIVFTKVAHGIGWFNTRVILILVYYLLVMPIGLIMRVFKKDPLDRRIDKEAGSYWVKREHAEVTVESLEKQF